MQHINGSTRLAGVIGWPITHTLSPAMHNAVYQQLGLDWVYLPLPVPDEVGLRRVVAATQSLPFVGFNVTMPYKQAVLELCDEVAMTATMAGSVNAVHCVDGRLVGYNTDGRGLLEALELYASFDPAGKNVVLLGAGGAAGAAFVAFILGKAASVTIVNRDVTRAEELIDRLAAYTGALRPQAVSLGGAEAAISAADLIVNATSVGMKPDDQSLVPGAWMRPGQLVYDMVYGTPEPTALMTAATGAGARAYDGLGMLVCQGATAIDIWNDSKQIRTPRQIMHSAAEAALASRRQGPRG